MEIIYRANDGTEFYDEDDCVEYERRLEYEKRDLKSRFFDKKGKEMNNTNIEDCYEHGWYVEFASLEEAEFYDKETSYLVGGTYFDSKPCAGRFYYDQEEGRWRNLEELYHAYAKVLNVFEPINLGE